MTIYDLKPGPEADSRIATQVMGWRIGGINSNTWYFGPRGLYDGHLSRDRFRPTQDMQDAMQVLEKLGLKYEIGSDPIVPGHYCILRSDTGCACRANARTPEMAICRVALLWAEEHERLENQARLRGNQ